MEFLSVGIEPVGPLKFSPLFIFVAVVYLEYMIMGMKLSDSGFKK